MTARGIVVAALALAAAFGVGRLTVAATPDAPRTERIVERGAQRTIIERHAPADLDEVRRVIREELARGAVSPPVVDEAEQAPRAESRDTAVALSEARAALDAGMADGRWTDDDRARLRAALLVLSPGEADELLDELLLALNSGQLQPDAHGPPI